MGQRKDPRIWTPLGDVLGSYVIRVLRIYLSRPEAVHLLISTKNSDLWPGPTPEVRDSWTFRHSAHAQSQVCQIWLAENTKRILCACSKSRVRPEVAILGAAKKSAASGNENAYILAIQRFRVTRHNINPRLSHLYTEKTQLGYFILYHDKVLHYHLITIP